MCGFCGLALNDPREAPSRDMLRRMSDSIVHRGPDDGTVHVQGPFGLGFRRLSIIDVAGGRQPLFNETGDVVCVMNGEVYNFRELRRELIDRGHRFRTGSDAEVLVHLYEEMGERLVERLVGMYAFAILDLRGERPRMVLGRDRLGIKPLYFAETADGLFFASETKAILESGKVAREMAPEPLLDYLVQGYVGGRQSAWSGIQRLPPSGILIWESGLALRVERTWDLPLDSLREPAGDGEILEWLDRVVGDRLFSEVPLGAFLSGGIDSSAVAASMRAGSEKAPLLCSVGFHERSHDELDLARKTAAHIGAEHETALLEPDPGLAIETLPWFYDEPLADPSTVPTYLVSRIAREYVTVALSGDGGDETFAGYRRYVHDMAENRLRRALGSPGRAVLGTVGRIYPRMDWAPRLLRGRTFLTNVADDPARAYWRSVSRIERSEALELMHPDLAQRLVDHDPFDAFAEHYRRPEIDDPLYRAQYADFHTYLPDQILAKVDRASMAVSLEVRVPILDHRFVERFAPLPAGQKIRGGRGKHVFREALRGRVLGEVLDGQKRGFDTPLAAWVRGPLGPAVAEAIETLPADWFQKPMLKRRLEEHHAGRRDHGRLLWSLLVLEHWRRRHAVRGLSA